MKTLKHLLVTSYEAKVMTVLKATSNKGKRTAGMDDIIWDTDAKQINAVSSLKLRGYKSLPLKGSTYRKRTER